MSWMLFIWAASTLLALCRGYGTVFEGYGLSKSGYHLCIHNETRLVSFLVTRKMPYTVTRPCGMWLPWRTCEVTLYRMTHQTEYKTVTKEVTRCCDGYEQVGSYCALPTNRSMDFTAKPGSCPSADGLSSDEDCEWDTDCPQWQKCCQNCTDPASSPHYSENGGWRFNVTVTVKTEYQQLISKDRGLLNHTRLLHAMVAGALDTSSVSVRYLSSWPVHPFRTATSLLIESNFTLSLPSTTSKLHLLLKHIGEVSSITVEDVDECVHAALRKCSLQAECNNTMGSYFCTCRRGYIDVDPSNSGAESELTTVEPLAPCNAAMTPTSTHPLPINTTSTPTFHTAEDIFTSAETNMPTVLNTTNSSHSYPSPPPRLTSLQSANVTGTSFCAYWSSQFQRNMSYLVILSQGSELISLWETNQTMLEVLGLQPGILYNVTVTPCACGRQGDALHVSVKTAAQTLDATARLTNVQFTADLLNSSSQAYLNLTKSIEEEIYQSLSPEIKAMVASGQVRIEIKSLSQGSVVVNFTIIFIPSQNSDINNVSSALLSSLMNSSKYTLDENNTSINDFDECASGENDCSQWAACTNTWASYTCFCLDSFIDNNPARPGRACQAMVSTPPSETATQSLTTTFPLITSSTTVTVATTTVSRPDTATVTASVTTIQAITTPTVATTAPLTTTSTPITTTSAPIGTTASTAPISTTASITSTTALTGTTATTTTTAAPIGTTASTAPLGTTASTTTTTILTASTTTTTIPTAPIGTSASAAPMGTAASTTITVAPTGTTESTASTATTAAPTATTAAPTAPIGTTTSPISTIITMTTAPPAPVSITAAPVTTSTAPTTPYTSTITSIAPSTTTTTHQATPGAISVHCRATAITVTIARDFLVSKQISDSALHLGLEECGVNGGNTTHAQLTVGWHECDTMLLHNETFYTAQVTLFNTMDPQTLPNGTAEVPKIRLEVPIMCTYRKSMLISTGFGPMGYDMIKDAIMGSGSFHVTVQLMNGSMALPQNYSLSPAEDVVVQVSLNTSAEQIKVVINKCWATPSRNPTDSSSYTFLQNSCPLPNTYTTVLENGNTSTSRLSVRIFSFVNLDVIYLHCQVEICVQIGSVTCVPDCTERSGRLSNTIATVYGSSGPLLRLDYEQLDEGLDTLHLVGFSCMGVALVLFFLGVFICLFYYQRNRIGHYNFSVKPKQENFSYLVFNT
ncbi:uromodulin-like 1 [Myripristis murdjan]|uniref:uromodulin-like 1 n=1 Tax=Myripristis murdjan TaxID=586833 RepID=UPI001175F8D3|nr:uromodulin-like 1 [Myripristis murdjan]